MILRACGDATRPGSPTGSRRTALPALLCMVAAVGAKWLYRENFTSLAIELTAHEDGSLWAGAFQYFYSVDEESHEYGRPVLCHMKLDISARSADSATLLVTERHDAAMNRWVASRADALGKALHAEVATGGGEVRRYCLFTAYVEAGQMYRLYLYGGDNPVGCDGRPVVSVDIPRECLYPRVIRETVLVPAEALAGGVTDGQAGGVTDGQAGGVTDGQADGQADEQADEHIPDAPGGLQDGTEERGTLKSADWYGTFEEYYGDGLVNSSGDNLVDSTEDRPVGCFGAVWKCVRRGGVRARGRVARVFRRRVPSEQVATGYTASRPSLGQ